MLSKVDMDFSNYPSLGGHHTEKTPVSGETGDFVLQKFQNYRYTPILTNVQQFGCRASPNLTRTNSVQRKITRG